MKKKEWGFLFIFLLIPSLVFSQTPSLEVSDLPVVKLSQSVIRADLEAPLKNYLIPQPQDQDLEDILRKHPQKDQAVLKTAHALMSSGLYVNSDQSPKKVAESFLLVLDPNRIFFTKSDVDNLSSSPLLQEDISKGDIRWAQGSIDLFVSRLKESKTPSLNALSSGKGILPWASPKEWNPQPNYQGFYLQKFKSLTAKGLTTQQAYQSIEKDIFSFLKKWEGVTKEEVFNIFTKAYVSSFDAHSLYLSGAEKESFQRLITKSYEGFGFVWEYNQKHILVGRVLSGGPAEKAGLKKGDEIYEVWNGEIWLSVTNTSQKSLEEIFDHQKVQIKLNVLRKKEKVSLVIKKEKVVINESLATSKIIAHANSRIAWVKLPLFYHDPLNPERLGGSASKDIKRLLGGQGFSGVILDLRDNAGGSMEEAGLLLSLFLDKGVFTQLKSQSSPVISLKIPEGNKIFSGPLVVLVNQRSASASEMVSSALQDFSRAVVVGQPTFGKATAQTIFDLDALSSTQNVFGQINLTTRLFYRPNGSSLQKVGVLPDIITAVKPLNSGEEGYLTALPPQPAIPAAVLPLSQDWKNKINVLKHAEPSLGSLEAYEGDEDIARALDILKKI